jgi:hypothetical protein
MEALNVDPNLNDDKRKKLMEKNLDEYLQAIYDNLPTDSDSITENELDDEEEEEEEDEDKDEDF